MIRKKLFLFFFCLSHKTIAFPNIFDPNLKIHSLERKEKNVFCSILYRGPLNTFKKLLNIFLNFFFYLKIGSFRLIMENNFIQMSTSAGHAVAYTIDPIFKHIIDCMQLYVLISTMASRILSIKRQLPLACRRKTYL